MDGLPSHSRFPPPPSSPPGQSQHRGTKRPACAPYSIQACTSRGSATRTASNGICHLPGCTRTRTEYTQTPKALEAPPGPYPAPTQTSLDPCKVQQQGEMRYHRSYAHASATILRPMPKATVPSASRHCFRPLCSACMCSCRVESNGQAGFSSAHQGLPYPTTQCEARTSVMNHERCTSLSGRPAGVGGTSYYVFPALDLGSRPASEISQYANQGFLTSPGLYHPSMYKHVPLTWLPAPSWVPV
ncbi:hypothetical protein V8C34DRAFT_142581 [Trichoderma compactum]